MRVLLVVFATAVALLLGPPLVCRVLSLGPDASVLPGPARAVEIGDGLHLNVLELGSGPPIVLVHGLPSDIGDWGALPERLAASGHHVVVYDRIGFGWSSRAPLDGDAYTYAANARQLAALLDRLGLERVALAGWSYGGGVVQELAAQQPARVSRLVLIASVGPALHWPQASEDPVDHVVMSPLGGPLLHWLAAVPPLARRVTARGVAEAFSGAEHVPPGWVDRTVAELAMPGTLDAYRAETQRADDGALRPEAIEAPTLVVQGRADRVVPPRVAEDLARRLPHAELAWIEGGSHMVPATHADALAERLHVWLSR